jgi:hypothetical protein
MLEPDFNATSLRICYSSIDENVCITIAAWGKPVALALHLDG